MSGRKQTSWLLAGGLFLLSAALTLLSREKEPGSPRTEEASSQEGLGPSAEPVSKKGTCPPGYVPYQGRCLPFEQ